MNLLPEDITTIYKCENGFVLSTEDTGAVIFSDKKELLHDLVDALNYIIYTVFEFDESQVEITIKE